LVDPRVSQAKFEREVAQYRRLQDDYIRRGWWMVKAEFPTVFVVFGSSKGLVKSVVFGTIVDFTNYDLWPPSVRLVDPFTMVPYKAKDLPSPLYRRIAAAQPATPTPAVAGAPTIPTPPSPTGPTAPGAVVPPAPQQPATVTVQPLAQAWGPEEIPFVCLPGVREYHDNPAHTGDSWLLHRGRGEGTLHFILEQLFKYGVQPMSLTLHCQVKFHAEEIPA
jgi:hypothetical protein